ncbi:hypothetical protein N7492_000541 [Penicillium capsulatum]|uniref:Protein phosphatase inhibitor 2 (IPP-2) n=1 Tax=Penicillium capsulatum TaxID=69766 RepID=A0A9W9ITR1_9EURO|nr:hypothetical protein N7492_000541 [Penicillium capsulatum]KAJ6130401.1 hypothetical protein N7512_003181 [Penicillium capsulatum]
MTTAPHMPVKAHSTDDVHHRPKGILKNNKSFSTAPAAAEPTVFIPAVPTIGEPEETKELTLQNTLQNAGRRRSSSTTQPGSNSRRQSVANDPDENSPRLKWDEANLYLTEQERTAKMKIDEPKTPYAPHYNPAEDDEQIRLEEAQESLIDAQDVVVDELDKTTKGGHHKKGVSEEDIPDLELGEPEDSLPATESTTDPRVFRDRSMSMDSHKSEKHVHVGPENGDAPDADHPMTTQEAQEKHRKFEKQRKQHYEMRNIKELLAHPENLDEMDEDEDEAEPGPPPAVPQIPQRFRNGPQ